MQLFPNRTQIHVITYTKFTHKSKVHTNMPNRIYIPSPVPAQT